jgi:hypothetical protein
VVNFSATPCHFHLRHYQSASWSVSALFIDAHSFSPYYFYPISYFLIPHYQRPHRRLPHEEDVTHLSAIIGTSNLETRDVKEISSQVIFCLIAGSHRRSASQICHNSHLSTSKSSKEGWIHSKVYLVAIELKKIVLPILIDQIIRSRLPL